MTSVRPDGTYRAVSDYYYAASLSSGLWSGVTAGGYYMGGAVTRVVTRNYKNNNDGDAPDTLTTNGYAWGQGGAVLGRVDYDKDTGDSGNTVWASTYSRDGAGLLTGAHIVDERERWVTLVNDAEGRVLQRDENDLLSTGDPKQLHYYFNGIRVGDISNNGTSNTDYAASIAAHVAVPGYGPFRGGTSGGMPYADFDQSYDAINALTYDATASSYTVQGGDTLQGIAHQLWGDASLWYLIADANGLGGSEPLAAGRLLTIPNKVHNAHNNADTWRPYDPNEAQGDLSPTDAKKPKGNKCGTFGQILAAVVAVAVAAILTTFGGPIGTILAPYAASAAQQGVLIATGNQRRFDWNALGRIAVDQFLPKTGNVFVDNAITQKVSIKLGLQKKFSWAGVATAGITAALNAVAGGAFPPGTSPILQSVVTNSASLILTSAATSLITGEDFGDTIMAALPSVIGQTIGQIAVDQISFGGGWAEDALDGTAMKAELGGDKLSSVLKAELGEAKTTDELFGTKLAFSISHLNLGGGPLAGCSDPGYDLKVRVIDTKSNWTYNFDPRAPELQKYLHDERYLKIHDYPVYHVTKPAKQIGAPAHAARTNATRPKIRMSVRRSTPVDTRTAAQRAGVPASVENVASAIGSVANSAIGFVQGIGDGISSALTSVVDWGYDIDEAIIGKLDSYTYTRPLAVAAELVASGGHTLSRDIAAIPSGLMHIDKTIDATAQAFDWALREDRSAYQVVTQVGSAFGQRVWNNSARENARLFGDGAGHIAAVFVSAKLIPGPAAKRPPASNWLHMFERERAAAAEAAAAETEGSLAAKLEAYGGPGGGHHLPAKSAFRGAEGYDPLKAPAIPNSELARLGVDHSIVSGAQQMGYRALSKSGNPLTWSAVEQVETNALVRGGMDASAARATVQNAISQLKQSGVAAPTRIPWSK